jgi:hypothetical protein
VRGFSTDNDTLDCFSKSGGSPCVGGLAVECDDQSDCASGEVCCGAFSQNQGYRQVQCSTSCDESTFPGYTPVRFCDPKAPKDECASSGGSCQGSGSLPEGFHVCK